MTSRFRTVVSLSFVLFAAGFGGYLAGLSSGRAGFPVRAAEAGEAKRPERLRTVDLPKGWRLVNVSTQCFSGGTCEPWWLIRSPNDASLFLYTNGELEYAFHEQ